MKVQSEIYKENEANGWFERVGKSKRFYHPEYILNRFNRKLLSESNIVEIGCSGGGNLIVLKSFAKYVYGIDLSENGINNLKINNIDGMVGNIASSYFKLNNKFDICMIPMVSMYIDDIEYDIFVKNIEILTKSKGYIYLSDFIVDDKKINQNNHDTRIQIYKRNLQFYIKKFSNYSLIDFSRIDYDDLDYLRLSNDFSIRKPIPVDDNNHAFISIWQKRN